MTQIKTVKIWSHLITGAKHELLFNKPASALTSKSDLSNTTKCDPNHNCHNYESGHSYLKAGAKDEPLLKKLYFHWRHFKVKMPVTATCHSHCCTCFGHLGQCDPNRNDPICVTSPKVAKASTVAFCSR